MLLVTYWPQHLAGHPDCRPQPVGPLYFVAGLPLQHAAAMPLWSGTANPERSGVADLCGTAWQRLQGV